MVENKNIRIVKEDAVLGGDYGVSHTLEFGYEYDKFVIETAHKIQEIQQDFNNLSDENKIKFQNDVMRAFMIKGIEGVSEYFSQWK